MQKLAVIQIVKKGPGWAPVNYMVELAARMFGTKAVHIEKSRFSLSMLLFVLQGRQRRADNPDLLLIVPRPEDLLMLAEIVGWRSSFNRAAVWIVDSFWLERAPPFGVATKFDKIFVMTGNDVEAYEARFKRPTAYLPWGADALELGLGAPSTAVERLKSIDLLRMGRQPDSLDDDAANRIACERAGMSYQGRPPYCEDTVALHHSNMGFYRQAKFVLANSNLASPKVYTHPTREYVTARWTDALAAGGIVAGMPPYADYTLQKLFWPGALLELSSIDRNQAVAAVREALDAWTPEHSTHNHRMALERLDWRWRFKEIADFFAHRFTTLENDLVRINAILEGQARSLHYDTAEKN